MWHFSPILAQPSLDAYEQSITKWHQNRLDRLKASDGWLTVCGLFWIKAELTTLGSGPNNDIIFPQSAPAQWGTIRRDGAAFYFESHHNEGQQPLNYLQGKPTIIQHEGLQWFLLKRGTKIGIRLRDTLHPNRLTFDTIPHFPIDPAWNIPGKFIPSSDQDSIKINNVLGMTFHRRPAGSLSFEYAGISYSLSVLDAGEKLFLIFSDLTSGAQTYGGGRYLYIDKPETEVISIDFNKSENPPCAFTPFATCLLPPDENKLNFSVLAGEQVPAVH